MDDLGLYSNHFFLKLKTDQNLYFCGDDDTLHIIIYDTAIPHCLLTFVCILNTLSIMPM